MTEAAAGAVARYRALAGALNRFFAAHLADACADCLELVRAACPDDPRARMTLEAGQFPGCCQSGADRDFTFPPAGKLPSGFVETFERERVRSMGRPGPPPAFVLRHRDGGELREGRGCGHLTPGGCRLGGWKSLLCLRFVCAPALERLRARAPEIDWGEPDDFLGMSEFFHRAVTEPPEAADRAVAELNTVLAACGARLRAPRPGAGEGETDEQFDGI